MNALDQTSSAGVLSAVAAIDQATSDRTVPLVLEHVYASYGPAEVLFDVNIRCGPNDVVGLLGRNGAGKTTTLLTILGLNVRARGRIACFGQDLSGLRTEARARAGLAWVPDSRRLFGNMTVAENLTIAAQIRTQRKKNWSAAAQVERVADNFPLIRKLMNRSAAHLSGGEQQMVAIGRALAMDLPILLIDEPTEGLAPAIVDDLQRAFENVLREFNLTILLAEQNLEFCLSLSNKVYIFESGRVVHESNAADFAKAADLQQRFLGVGD